MRVPLSSLAVLVAATALGACGSSPSVGASGDDAGTMAGGDQSFPPTGNQYVDQRRCPACHQSSNPQVDGFMAGTSQPIAGDFGQGVALYGPNLTPDPDTGIGNWTDEQIQNAILNGIDNQGERLCPEMGHFPDMQQDEVTSIIGYLRGLTPVSHQAPISSCPPLKP